MRLEHGGKRRGAGRKTAEQETPRKTLRGGKRPGGGRPWPRLAPTSASVAKAEPADRVNQVGTAPLSTDPSNQVPLAAQAQTPEEFLGEIMNDSENPIQTRMDAAELLMRYGRSGGRGKKATLEEAAKAASKGRFATPPPPTLAIELMLIVPSWIEVVPV